MAISTGSSFLDTNTLQQLTDARIAIVYTEWNDAIVQELKGGCERIATQQQVTIAEAIAVPGAFELPFGCRMLWQHYQGKASAPEAIIALGAVIQGGTPHFEYVSGAVTDGIVQLNLTLPIPVIFGVLTLNTEQQAWERLGGVHGHKGEEAAITALRMIQMARKLKVRD